MEVGFEETIKLDENPRLSLNQIKKILNVLISPLDKVNVVTAENHKVELSSEVLVELLLSHLDRKQILELLDMIRIIRGRKSTIQHYLQYILQGISYKEDKVRLLLK